MLRRCRPPEPLPPAGPRAYRSRRLPEPPPLTLASKEVTAGDAQSVAALRVCVRQLPLPSSPGGATR